MDEIHVHKTKKSICAHFAESPCSCLSKYPTRAFLCCYFKANSGKKFLLVKY